MTAQIIESFSLPQREKINPVRNPPIYETGNIVDWLKLEYRGNKPFGGLWTSSQTPGDEYICDWQRGRRTNQLIQLAFPAHPSEIPAHILHPSPGARVCEIRNMVDAVAFTDRYHLATIPIPESLRCGLALTLCAEITDWEQASIDYDAIHLTAEAADEIAWMMVHQGEETAFHAWNCESTLWTQWVFDSYEAVSV